MDHSEQIREKIQDCDAVIIGASNGFSIAEGLNIFADDAAFEKLFGDLKRKYGIRNILHGLLTKWPDENARWCFYSRLAAAYSLNYTGSPVMEALKAIIADRPFFIITSNGENHFELAGLPADHILEIEGSWKTLRCARSCSDERVISWDILRKLHESEEDGLIDTSLIPSCPHCGGPMMFSFSADKSALDRYQAFLARYSGKKIVILELGIGPRNQLIKAPLMDLAYREPHAYYAAFNKGELYIPEEIAQKSAVMDGDLGDSLKAVAEGLL